MLQEATYMEILLNGTNCKNNSNGKKIMKNNALHITNLFDFTPVLLQLRILKLNLGTKFVVCILNRFLNIACLVNICSGNFFKGIGIYH